MTLTIATLSESDLNRRLANEGLLFSVGPFNIRLNSCIPSITEHFRLLYGNHPLLSTEDFIDFHIKLSRPRGIRRYFKPQVIFSLDGYQPFTPLPLPQASAQFEWGLNWCIASHSHQYLIVHSAVVEKNGVCLIMPGAPGSGKSTLCARLVLLGWRLLSDEMALIDPDALKVQPVPRPISLKGASIALIKSLQPGVNFGPVIPDTTKGDLCHMQAQREDVLRQQEMCSPSFVLFPKYDPVAKPTIEAIHPAWAAYRLAENAFNFNILGEDGFNAFCNLAEQAPAFQIVYSDTEQALSLVEEITAS